MITDAIREFPKQFKYEPEIKNADKLTSHNSYVIAGMGGSGLVAGILRALKPELDIAAHHEYGLPTFIDDGERRLLIAVSYSGNTEETVDFLESALKKNLPVAAISTGGELIKIADKNGIPYILLPDEGIQPRMGLGYMLRAALKLISEEKLFEETGKLAEALKPEEYESRGRELAGKLGGCVPIIYSSRRNQTVAYNWKIKFNETAKIPAFYNVFPELNHNEMNGFDINDETRDLFPNARVLILKDDEDHKRILRRMDVLEGIYKKRGIAVDVIEIEGGDRMEKIFNTLILADWAAYHLALHYKNEPEQVPMVEEFKNLIK